MRVPDFTIAGGSLEVQVRHIQFYLSKLAKLVQQDSLQAATPGGDPTGTVPDVGNPPLDPGSDLAPDVTGPPDDNTVEQIQRTPIPAPDSSVELFLVRVNAAADAFEYVDPAGLIPAVGSWQMAGWFSPDISAEGTTAAAMHLADSNVTALADLLLDDYNVIGVGVLLSGDVGSGNTFEVELYFDQGVGLTATGHKATVQHGVAGGKFAITTGFIAPLLEADQLTLYCKKSGTPGALQARAFVLLSAGGGTPAGWQRITFNAEDFTVAATGTNYRVTLDFSGSGTFIDEDFIAVAVPDDPKIVVNPDFAVRTSGQCCWDVYVPSDAGAGSYGGPKDVRLTVSVLGRGWSGVSAGPFAGAWTGPDQIL